MLLLGSLFPDSVSAVIGYVPSALVAAALNLIAAVGAVWLQRVHVEPQEAR